ncbi:MAG TPA: cobalamin-binding protein [Candidatus Limnocylindrales bacterium]|nr:cobalamin-binding protein [Candidatus Limnocylindrales bacterium]
MGYPLEVTDDVGRLVYLEKPPERIISLVPSITEILFAFGVGDRIVGVTDYCTEPEKEVAQKEKVGGTKKPRREKILKLRPDLVIMNAEENRKEDAEYLKDHGIIFYVTFPRTVAQSLKMMWNLAQLTGSLENAEKILRPIERLYQQTLQRVQRSSLIKVFCPIWKMPYMSFNTDTYIDNLITLCGGQNIFKDKAERYFKVTLEEVVQRNPDVILLPDEPYKFSEVDLEDFQPFPEVSAVKMRQIYLIDGKLLSWYGPRMKEGVLKLQELFSKIPSL